jgi:hypothetical protein
METNHANLFIGFSIAKAVAVEAAAVEAVEEAAVKRPV